MTILKRLFGVAIAMAVLGAMAAQAAERPRIVIQAIIDNGGTVTEEDAQDLIKNFVGGLANLRGRAFSKARIDLILTSHPTTVWSGTPRDLMAQGRAVLDLAKTNDKCADVARAIKQANQNLRIAQADEAYLFIVSPLINAPFPCDAGPGIRLPQPVPQGIAIGRMIDERQIKALTFLGVHPSQEDPWTNYLVREGVLERAKRGQLDFQFLGFQQSKTFLAKQRLLSRKD